jgi:hypothetical protein
LINLLQGVREDYQVIPESLDALTRFFKREAEFEFDVLDKVWQTAQLCFNRPEHQEKLYPLFQQITLSSRVREEKEKLFSLFAQSLWLTGEIESVKSKLAESMGASDNLEREKIVVEVAIARFQDLHPEAQRKLQLIQVMVPALARLTGEAARLAKELLPYINRREVIPKNFARPLSSLVTVRTEAESAEVKIAQVAKLTVLAENLFDAYRGAIFPTPDSSAVEGFLGNLRSYLPYIVNLAFVKNPRPLSHIEKQAILSVLNAGSRFLGDLDTLKKEKKPSSAKALVQLAFQKDSSGPAYIRNRLELIVRFHKGGSDPYFPSEPSKGEQFASELMVGFLFYVIERLFQPRIVLRLIERLLDEEMDLETLEKKFPPLSSYAADDEAFSRNSGERLEWLLRKAVSLFMGSTAATNLAIKFFNQKAVGNALQRFINKTLQSEVDMLPLMIIAHLLLEKGKASLLEPLKVHSNLAQEVKTKISDLIKGGSAIAGWFMGGNKSKLDKALGYLSEVIVAFAESQEGLYIIAGYMLDGYLDFLVNTRELEKKTTTGRF